MRIIIAGKFEKHEVEQITVFITELQRKRKEAGMVNIMIQCGIDE